MKTHTHISSTHSHTHTDTHGHTLTLQVRAQAGDEAVQAASQAVVHLGVGGRSRQQQAEHQSEGRLGVSAVQPSGQVDHQRQTVERPGLWTRGGTVQGQKGSGDVLRTTSGSAQVDRQVCVCLYLNLR